jgi:hypothetical protein
MRAPRFTAILLFLAMMLLFLIANRGAYEGYFQNDDLDNISWTPFTPLATYAREVVSPRLSPVNFRPVGHFYFRVLASVAGLRFPWYVAGIHALHFVNVWLLYLLMRRVAADRFTSGAAALFFAFHMALFDAYWKPMYVFDVLCALFALLCLHAWMRRRWVLSFVCFWLAYKSKEVAVMLPAVLACYEFSLGERKWKPLIAFFAASLGMGIQGLFFNPNAGNDYTLRLTAAGLWSAARFYAAQVLLIPYAGFALLALPLAVRHKRAWFGLAMAMLTLAPMLLLTNRLYAAYLYLPLAGLALAFPPLTSRRAQALATAAFLVWIPFNHGRLRENRRAALTIAQENRAYVEAVGKVVGADREVRTFVYDGAPSAMSRWGVEGAIRYFAGPGELHIYSVADRDYARAFAAERFGLLVWDARHRRLQSMRRAPGTTGASYIGFDGLVPIGQLAAGWFPPEGAFRWIQPHAAARLYRPPRARRFELAVNAGPGLIADLGKTEVEVRIDGAVAGRATFAKPGLQTVWWTLAAAPAGDVNVEFRVAPAYRPPGDPRLLGIAITGFGFR